MDRARQLDQFFTIPSVAHECAEHLSDLEIGKLTLFVEPAAGGGAILDAIHTVFPDAATLAYDIDPSRGDIAKQDFLLFELAGHTPSNTIVFTNPPFGKRASLAIRFFNKAAATADTVAFIAPFQFKKWSVQSKLDPTMALIYQASLKPASFTFKDKAYALRCVFQVWTRLPTRYTDLRLRQRPAIRHPDFQMWQYNRTPGALNVFEQDFDFGVPRQGYVDFSRRETSPDACERKTQWILFKAKNQRVLERLWNIDFSELATMNTSTPGFGKADVVKKYQELYPDQL